jgi:integrase
VRAWLILGGFCGLRLIEVTRSDWSAVDWGAKEFHVRPEATKRDKLRNRGIRERIVAMPDVAIRLLPKDQTGPIVPVSPTTMQEQVCKLAVALAKHRGEPLRTKKHWRRGKVSEIETADWPHDCLRHSAATYMLAVENEAGPVAKFLGHDQDGVRQLRQAEVPRGG